VLARPLARAGRRAAGHLLLAFWGCSGQEPVKPATPVVTASAPGAAVSAPLPRPSAPPVPDAPGAVIPRDGPRVYAKARFVWVREAPGDEGWIGYLWLGGSARLRDQAPHYGPGCDHWVAIEPRGFVCVDGKRATLDPDDPVLAAIRPFAPALERAWPHRYAESRGLPRYEGLPSREEQRRREWDLESHLARVADARRGEPIEALRGVDLSPASEPPPLLPALHPTTHEQHRELKPLSTVAYSREALHDGRTFLLTADLMWVPKDRVAPYPEVTFHGVVLGRDARLPLAFFRGEDRPQQRRGAGGEFEPAGGRWRRLSFVELTGERAEQDGVTYLETRDRGLWVKAEDAVVPTLARRTPWGAPLDGPDTTGRTPAGRATWLEASVMEGWLLAYEGQRPVYATMISPGRGGIPVPGKDPLETASTPVGVFKITGKFATATMVAPHQFIHSDVPWTQNFSGPHALHGAYWHDDWGNRMSAGCVNVSPTDGRWLFEFTEPRLPSGWHGVRWQPASEPATTFVVHR